MIAGSFALSPFTGFSYTGGCRALLLSDSLLPRCTYCALYGTGAVIRHLEFLTGRLPSMRSSRDLWNNILSKQPKVIYVHSGVFFVLTHNSISLFVSLSRLEVRLPISDTDHQLRTRVRRRILTNPSTRSPLFPGCLRMWGERMRACRRAIRPSKARSFPK